MKVLYYLPETRNPFWREVIAGIKAKGLSQNVQVEVVECSHDQKLQLSQLTESLNRKPDAVFVSPVFMTDCLVPCKAIKDAGIPVIAVDQNMGQNVTASVISGNMKGGYLAAKYLAEKLRPASTIVHIKAEPLPNVIVRTNSFVDEIRRRNLTIIASPQADSNREKARVAMDRFLKEGRTFQGLFAENDAMALGAIDSLQYAGYTPWPLIVGFDGVPEALEAIRQGKMSATIAQNPKRLGERSIDVLLAAVNRKPFETVTTELPTLVTIANLTA
ncbi:MAG: sugar ABC transporter substrate-binding protein [Acidobacteria bacterium]|nr:MAG: sugar ABC transporter substrate-binding protein [Acidobacteriota bacterium]